MSQINITLNYQEALDLFSKDRNEAFVILIQKTLNAFYRLNQRNREG